MNAPDRIQSAKPTFKWDDPLLIDEQLSEEERMVRERSRTHFTNFDPHSRLSKRRLSYWSWMASMLTDF